MKTFICNNLDKWMHQNGAEVCDIIEGCLLDNYLVQTRKGWACILENYVNCWTSNHKVIFSRDTSACNEFYERFEGVEG